MQIAMLALLGLLIACATSGPRTAENPKTSRNITVAHTEDYDPKFVAELAKTGPGPFNLIDDKLVVSGDTVAFPNRPKVAEHVVFTGRQGDLAISLTVKRVNQTTIDYRIEMVEFGKSEHNEEGRAHLSPGFYLGAETDEIDGLAYSADEYLDNSKQGCLTKIRIGESSGQLRAKLYKSCNGKLREITLDNFPALNEK